MTYIGVATVTFGGALILNLLVEAPLTVLGKHLEHYLKEIHHRENEEGGGYDAAAQSPSILLDRSSVFFDGKSEPSSDALDEEAKLLRKIANESSQGYSSF